MIVFDFIENLDYAYTLHCSLFSFVLLAWEQLLNFIQNEFSCKYNIFVII
jgi:hypothetical protein